MIRKNRQKRITLSSFICVFGFSLSLFAGKPQSLKKIPAQLGSQKIEIEIARTEQQRQIGLMFRKKALDADSGMLFVFEKEQVLSFWMKNTFIPLSIGFFDQNRILIDIQQMEPCRSEMQLDFRHYKSLKPAKYALEMNQGWFKKNKIKTGVQLKY